LDVDQGIRVEEEEVGKLARFDCASRLEFAQKLCGIFCGRLKCLHGSETSLDQESELFVERGAGEDVGSGRVGSCHEVHAGGLHLADDLDGLGEQLLP